MKQNVNRINAFAKSLAGLIVLLLALWPSTADAQCSKTTEGRDFWFMFMDNYVNDSELSLTITAANTVNPDGSWVYVNVNVANPGKSWATSAIVPVSGAKVISIPLNKALDATVNANDNTVTDYGFHITSTVDVSVYASNFQDATFDIATLYPTSTLDTEYVVQTYDGLYGNGTEVGFVATEDETEIRMKLPCSTLSGGYSAGDSLTISLNQGETFLLKAVDGCNLSGMHVMSNGRPFAMFQGTVCANVPTGCAACDHLYEQALPLKMWDQTYVIAPVATHTGGDRAIVTAAYDSCVVTYDGNTLCTLNAGDSHEFEVSSSNSHVLESTSPVTVCLYIKGQSCAGGYSDPSAVIIPPVTQGLNKVRFEAISTDRTEYHYVNIIVPTDAKDSMAIDGEPVGGPYKDLDCGYSTRQLPVTAGTHTLTNPIGKFVAYFYGLGDYESYAYIAGMSLRDLRNRIYVNEEDKTGDTAAYVACLYDTVDLRVDINNRKDPGTWFIDGEYVHYIDTLVHYYFDEPGLHRIDAVSPNECDTLTAYVFIRTSTDTIAGEICFGEQYTIDTFSFSTSGNHTFALEDHYGCDSLITLQLTIIDSFYAALVDTGCFDHPYSWRGRQLDSTGYYVDTLTSSHGCDSVVALDLTIMKQPVISFSSTSHCEDGSYTLAVDLTNAATDGVWPEHRWFSDPPDPALEGHENELEVRVYPKTYTAYSAEVYYRCPFIQSVGLNVVDVPKAAIKVVPESLDYDRPSFEAHDISQNATQRQWWVDNQLMSEQSSALHRDVDVRGTDSVLLMLVAADGICSDTARRTLPVWHTGVYAPNVFIPEDYAQGRFVVEVHDVQLESVTIFNRNGQRVYHNETDPGEGWDGTLDGKPCPQGAYVWTAVYRRNDSPTLRHVTTGNVTLLR